MYFIHFIQTKKKKLKINKKILLKKKQKQWIP